MAVYCVLQSRTEDYADPSDRFPTRRQADAKLAEIEATGQFARIVRWIDSCPKEMARGNDTAEGS